MMTPSGETWGLNMTLSKMSKRQVVKTTVGRHVAEVQTWLDEQGLEAVQHYDYLGRENACDVFAFENRDVAMLFKLTFGGK